MTTKAQLRRTILELQAQLASVYAPAISDLTQNCSIDRLMGGGILVQLTGLGGGQLVDPFVIRDGLSIQTIDALSADLARSYDLATLHKPGRPT